MYIIYFVQKITLLQRKTECRKIKFTELINYQYKVQKNMVCVTWVEVLEQNKKKSGSLLLVCLKKSVPNNNTNI